MIGHERVRAAIGSRFPRVMLFIGPPSVGKRTLAETIRKEHNIGRDDVLRVGKLSVLTARDVVRYASMAPRGDYRLLIVRLDGSSQAAQNVLLKALEEAPETTRFILTSEDLPQPTIASRCEVHRFSLLSDEEVVKVLLEKDFKEGTARKLAALSGGRVRRALEAGKISDLKVPVLSMVRALMEKDGKAVELLSTKWTDEHTDLLATLCRERITARWSVFQEAEVGDLTKILAFYVLQALRTDAKPKLMVRTRLMTILRGL